MRERGFALLLALWSVVLLALLTWLTSAGRSEVRLAANLRDAAVMEAQADGLVQAAIFRLMSDSPAVRGVTGLDSTVPVPGGRGVVRISSLAGKINPNTASAALLGALLQRVGASPPIAAALAAAILDWRTPGERARPLGAKAAEYAAAGRSDGPTGKPFETVDEMGQVLGMTPDLLARLAPHMTVFYSGAPVLADADPLGAQVLQSLPVDEDETDDAALDDGVYARVEARVSRGPGLAFIRRADVWAGHGRQQGRYIVLRWDVPPGS